MRLANAFLGSLVVLCSLPAAALPGEAAAVVQYCGQPNAENQATSPVTNTLQRDLYYNDLILHFEPQAGGWSFTTAWRNHLPMTRGELESRLPCFRNAMAAAAAAPQPVMDPTIATQETAQKPINAGGFGIPFFWLIVVLGISLLVITLWPERRSRAVARTIEERPYRKPRLVSVVPPPSRNHIDPDLMA